MSKRVLFIGVVMLALGLLAVIPGQPPTAAPAQAKVAGSAQSSPQVVADTSDDGLPTDSFVAVDSMPELIYQAAPKYPEEDKKAGLSGKVWVKALINRQGLVRKALVLRLDQGATDAMGKAAVEAALQNKFHPARSKGRPAACWVTYAVSFVLSDKQPADTSKVAPPKSK